jgi:ribosome-associated translation inhibitor RaiA
MKPIEFVILGARPDNADSIREYTTRRLSFALRRFEHAIRRVTVRVIDLNGPKQGADSRCSMIADLEGGRRIFVDATTAWPFASITRAARRLGAALRRDFGRAHNHRSR